MTEPATTACDTCKHFNASGLKKLGLDSSNCDFVIALSGNPNTGKSTVFNALTGLNQHTGNWPGKTVVRAEGAFSFEESRYKLVDLPGTYSLLSTSQDEEVARNFILFGSPDVTVIVVDASRLERNLNLVLQVLEITDRAVLCLNIMDEAKRHGISIDERTLSRDLGIPLLIQTIAQVANREIVCKPHRIKSKSAEINESVTELSNDIEKMYPGLPNSRWIAIRLLEGDKRVMEAMENNELYVPAS